MGIHVQWDTEQKTIIRQTYGPTWNWEEYLIAFQETRQLANEVNYKIGMMGEVPNLKLLPPQTLIQSANAIRTLPANIVLSVLVTPSKLLFSALKVVINIGQFDTICSASTVEEARLLIEQARNIPSTRSA